MRKKILLSLLVTMPILTWAQSYVDVLLDYREGYKQSLLSGAHPLKPEDTAYLRFYEPDPDYRVRAEFVPVNGAKPFMIESKHGGARKSVKEYGYVYFNLKGAALTLRIYRFVSSGALFIAFTDRTNYKETFQGGRYLDVSANDINDGRVVLDFNKCYNPHTAYEMGYPYLIAPRINSLRLGIEAGEKIFGHNPGY